MRRMRLDVSGDAHGLRGRLIRALRKASSTDLDHARRHAQYMRDGDYVLAVEVGNDANAKRGVADALRAAGAEFLNYYGENYIESLSALTGPHAGLPFAAERVVRSTRWKPSLRCATCGSARRRQRLPRTASRPAGDRNTGHPSRVGE